MSVRCLCSRGRRSTVVLCVILAAAGSARASPEPTWAREIGVGGKRIIAWEPPQQARAASLLGQDSACEGGVGTCVVACTDFACSAAQVRCAALAWCVGFSRPSKDVACGRKCLNRDATLKRDHAFDVAGAPDWWVSASRNCLDARRRALAGPGGAEAVRVWVEQGCDVYGAAWPARSSTLVFDVGLAGGEDTRLFLSRGWRVLAVEANPAVARAATTTPALRRATRPSSSSDAPSSRARRPSQPFSASRGAAIARSRRWTPASRRSAGGSGAAPRSVSPRRRASH